MDEKTIIAGTSGSQPATPATPPAPEPEKTAAPVTPADDHATIIAPFKPVVPPVPGKATPKAQVKNAPVAPGKGAMAEPGVAGSKPAGRSNVPVTALLGLMLALIGLGSVLTTVYVLSPNGTQTAAISDAELENTIVAIQSSDSEAEDEALIKDAITPRIIALSGDPVIIRQLSSSPRQLVKLVSAAQQRAMDSLGIRSDLFRLKDVLDVPNPGLQSGVFGSQEDIAVAQSSETSDMGGGNGAPGSEALTEEGSSIILTAGAATAERIAEFAQEVKAKVTISEQLTVLGFDAAHANSAAVAFAAFYGRETLEKGDRLAVRAASMEEQPDLLQPVQMSVYSADELVGSIALNDIDAFAKSEDPWYQRDIFETQLLPDDVRPEDRPRLLDAIYAAALRDRVPAAVVGETMMLLSRALDLEQKVQPGDSLTLIYSPIARDLKTGLGRIVFVSIGRTSGDLECYVLQSANMAFECVSAAGQNSVVAGGMVVPVNGIVVAKFGPQGASADASQEPMNFGVDWTAPLGSPVVAAFAGDVTAVGPEAPFGTVIRMSHLDDKTTMYAYLQRVAAGIAVGSSVKAGQVIGYVGTPASSREPRLHFELRNGGVPVDPVGEVQSAIGAGGAIDQFVRRIIMIESANRCNARNPLSTAVGLGQFIESTWMTTIRLHRPDLLAGRSRREVLDMRTNCDLARAMTAAFTNDNAAVIRKAGHSVTPGNLYLAHFLGVGGAIKVLGSQQNRQIAEVFGQSHVRANPFEQGKTTGYLVSWAAKKMSSHAPAPAVSTPAVSPPAVSARAIERGNTATSAGTDAKAPAADAAGSTAESAAAPLEKSAGDPALAKLKDAVLAFLQ